MQDAQTSASGVPVSTGRRLRLALILFLTLPLYTTSRAKAPKLAQDPHLLSDCSVDWWLMAGAGLF
jgi:hypothetical protein